MTMVCTAQCCSALSRLTPAARPKVRPLADQARVLLLPKSAPLRRLLTDTPPALPTPCTYFSYVDRELPGSGFFPARSGVRGHGTKADGCRARNAVSAHRNKEGLVKIPKWMLKMVAGLVVALAATAGAGHTSPAPPVTGCVQTVKVV